MKKLLLCMSMILMVVGMRGNEELGSFAWGRAWGERVADDWDNIEKTLNDFDENDWTYINSKGHRVIAYDLYTTCFGDQLYMGQRYGYLTDESYPKGYKDGEDPYYEYKEQYNNLQFIRGVKDAPEFNILRYPPGFSIKTDDGREFKPMNPNASCGECGMWEVAYDYSTTSCYDELHFGFNEK